MLATTARNSPSRAAASRSRHLVHPLERRGWTLLDSRRASNGLDGFTTGVKTGSWVVGISNVDYGAVEVYED